MNAQGDVRFERQKWSGFWAAFVHPIRNALEIMRMSAGNPAVVDGAMRLTGTIEGEEFLGEFLRYDVQVNGARVVVDHAHARGELSLATGTAVTLSVPAEEIRFIAA